MYFLGRDSEADPNLWATGIGGALYGSRIDTAVTSDIFTPKTRVPRWCGPTRWDGCSAPSSPGLDEGGRFLHLGTRVGPNDNNVELLRRLIGEAEIVEQDGYYTKYANGVAVVVFPAIQMDDDGNEISYWPERFPLDSKLILPDGTEFLADELSMARQKVLAKEGAHRIRGLREIRTRDPAMFETVYQQNPPSSEAGSSRRSCSTSATTRSGRWGVAAGRPLILGWTRRGRAGRRGAVGVGSGPAVATVVDLFYGEKLGLGAYGSGCWSIRSPGSGPVHGYEYNHDASVLEHPEVISAVNATRTELVRHFTASNRIEGEVRWRPCRLTCGRAASVSRGEAARPSPYGPVEAACPELGCRSVAAGRPAAHRSAPTICGWRRGSDGLLFGKDWTVRSSRRRWRPGRCRL